MIKSLMKEHHESWMELMSDDAVDQGFKVIKNLRGWDFMELWNYWNWLMLMLPVII